MPANKRQFRIIIIIYIIIYAAACIWGAAVPAQGNSYERGATIYFPKDAGIVSGEFKVNGSVFAKEAIQSARLILQGTEHSKAYDISGVMIPIFLFMKPGKMRDKMYNLLFIWGLGGALMALLTPEMGGYAFPSYYYFNFFIKHSMIIFGVLIATFFYGMRPNIKYLGWVMIVSTAIVAVVYGIDQLVQVILPYEPGNYMFLSYPPTGGSLIDLLVDIFGPSPYYIIGLEIIGALIYMILWLPFYIFGKIAGKRIS